MAATSQTDDAIAEECPECVSKTPHDVSIQLLVESQKAQNAEYSREPYRVSVCQQCGHEEQIRMNNA